MIALNIFATAFTLIGMAVATWLLLGAVRAFADRAIAIGVFLTCMCLCTIVSAAYCFVYSQGWLV